MHKTGCILLLKNQLFKFLIKKNLSIRSKWFSPFCAGKDFQGKKLKVSMARRKPMMMRGGMLMRGDRGGMMGRGGEYPGAL